MGPEEKPLDRHACAHIVTEYMVAQGWRLVDPKTVAEAVWQKIQGETVTTESIRRAVWLHYAVVLHDACRDPQRENDGWHELREWLAKQVSNVINHEQDQQDIVQETVVALREKLQRNPLAAPRTLWAYALNVLRNKRNDLHRRRTAVTRGGGDVQSLDEPQNEKKPIRRNPLAGETHGGHRTPEQTLSTMDTREQIRRIFREHLSDLQQQVAESHFLDGLAPAEIAGLLGKKPHEIRMAKARALRRLRNLPPEVKAELRTLLAAPEENDDE